MKLGSADRAAVRYNLGMPAYGTHTGPYGFPVNPVAERGVLIGDASSRVDVVPFDDHR